MKKQTFVIALFCISIFFVGLSEAHSPSDMILDYNFATDVLTVRVNHGVSDVNTHYIELIEIWVNDVLNVTRGYTSQTTTAYHEDTFDVPAVHSDIIKVKATCNIAGSYQNQITVEDPAIPEFGIAIPLMFFLVAGSILGWRIHKRHTNRK